MLCQNIMWSETTYNLTFIRLCLQVWSYLVMRCRNTFWPGLILILGIMLYKFSFVIIFAKRIIFDYKVCFKISIHWSLIRNLESCRQPRTISTWEFLFSSKAVYLNDVHYNNKLKFWLQLFFHFGQLTNSSASEFIVNSIFWMAVIECCT